MMISWIENLSRILREFSLVGIHKIFNSRVQVLKTLSVFLLLFMSLNLKAAEKDIYKFLWLDPDKSVYVLQNKEFFKEGKNYVDVGYIKGMSTDFQDTMGFQLKVGHYFTEEWGVELLYTYHKNDNDSAFESLQTLETPVIPYIRKISSYYAALVNWAPFYGKINTFNKIYYFDLIFGVGPTLINGETNRDSFGNNKTAIEYAKESYMGVALKAEIKGHITENINVGLGAIWMHYPAYGPINGRGKEWKDDTDVVLSVGFSF